MTMTLDTLEVFFAPLLVKHPEGCLLLLGLPGQPNTHWPLAAELTASRQAAAAGALLAHLVAAGALSDHAGHPGVPLFWVGVGAGSGVMLEFALSHLRGDPSMRALRDQTVLLMTVNGFSFVDAVLRSNTETFQKLLLEGTTEQRCDRQ